MLASNGLLLCGISVSGEIQPESGLRRQMVGRYVNRELIPETKYRLEWIKSEILFLLGRCMVTVIIRIETGSKIPFPLLFAARSRSLLGMTRSPF